MTDLQARIKRELEIAYKNGILHATGQSFTEPEVAVQVGYDMIARAIREAGAADVLEEKDPTHADH